MPVIHTTATVVDGAAVKVRFHLSHQELYHRRSAGLATPQAVDLTAVIDTAAEITCLDSAVVHRLGLPIIAVGLTNTPGLGGVGSSGDYDASLAILHPSGRAADNLVIPDLFVTGVSLGGTGYDALIGRDVLARCVLIYDGVAGTFTLTY